MRPNRNLYDFLYDSGKGLLNSAAAITILTGWMLGFVYAKGFWSTLLCWFPPYAWYITIEHFVNR